jgi:tetratricopeptide (TPR) repeat protein
MGIANGLLPAEPTDHRESESREVASADPQEPEALHAGPAIDLPRPLETVPVSHRPSTASAAGGPVDLLDLATPDTSGPKPRQLLGVRLRPEGPVLRLVFLFDAPTAYNLRREPDSDRVVLELINARISYLPPEMARLNDPRIEGIWIRRIEPGLATLELRLPSPAIHLEHFALTDPPALIVDLSDPSRAITRVDSPRIAAALPPAMPESRELIRVGGGAVVPIDWLDALPTAHAPSSDTLAAAVVPALPDMSVEETTFSMTVYTRQAEPTPEPLDVDPRSIDFEGFPIESIDVGSPLAREIFDDFLARRWAMVVDKALTHLKNNPINKESIDVLYLMAEARWQLGQLSLDPPMNDIMNFYEQALHAHDNGPLGAFGHARLAQAYEQLQDGRSALYQVDLALDGANDLQLLGWALLKARLLALVGQENEALRLLERLDKQDLGIAEQVEVAKLIGAVRLQTGDAEGAWKSYERATALDPGWTNLDFGNWEKLAIAARDTGHYRQAASHVQELLRNYGNRDKSENYKLLLLHAELLERLGDTDVAEQTYATVLREFGKSLSGAEIQSKTRKQFPLEVLQSEGRYCMILWRRGKYAQAMGELHRTHNHCLREGIDPKPLQPIIETVLPDFMRSALEENQPFETAQAWRLYNHFVEAPKQREACLDPLGEGLERLGLYPEALQLMHQHRGAQPTAERVLREGRLLLVAGEVEKARVLLEKPLPTLATRTQQAEADFLLAKVYGRLGEPLQAAQAFQAVAENPHAPIEDRGTAFLTAGNLFLDAGLPLQSIELGIKAIMLEGDARNNDPPAWNAATGNALRLMLAQSYLARGDTPRGDILLEYYLARPEGSAGDRAMARLLAAQTRRRLGRLEDAIAHCQAVLDNEATPRLYADQARTLIKLLAWDKDHPRWAIFPTPQEVAGAVSP